MNGTLKPLTDRIVLREYDWEIITTEKEDKNFPGMKVRTPGFEIHDIEKQQKVYLPISVLEKLFGIYSSKQIAFREKKKERRAEMKAAKEHNNVD